MNLENPMLSHFKRYRNFYITIGVVVLFVIMVGVLFQSCGDYFFNREVEKEKGNFNAAMNDANKIEQVIDNLNRKAIEQGAEVNQKKIEYNRAIEESDNQQVIINAQREVINALEKEKAINVTLEEFNRNRCAALPNANGCR